MKNKIFHTQDLCLRTNLRCAKMGIIMIRKAELKDIPAVMDIYNDAILHTTATFDTEIKVLRGSSGVVSGTHRPVCDLCI